MVENDAVNIPMVEGIAISGDYVFNLKDKHFTIIASPEYKEMADYKDKTKVIRKLVCVIELAENRERIEYYPNMKSQKAISSKAGHNLTNWTGYTGEFIIAESMIGESMKKVIYVKV